MTKYDILIIGAGVMGLSIAKHLPEHLNICIIDRNTKGMHASYAAGGMLGAQNEFHEDSPLFRLSMQGRSRMKETVDFLEEQTGIPIFYRREGLIKILTSTAFQRDFKLQYEFLKAHDSKIKLLDQSDLRHLHSQISASTGILIPDDAQVDAKQYTIALRQLMHQKSNVDILDDEVVEIQKDNNFHVKTLNEIVQANKIVVAAGAWSNDLCHMLNIDIPVKGMRGEVAYLYHPHLNLKQTLFGTNGCYIVPKHDHHYLIGATTHNDREVKVTQKSLDWLLKESSRIIPDLKNAQLIDHWSGVRPYASKLIMDEIQPDIYLTTGHYRNGILLSDITGYYMSELIQSRRHPEINAFKQGGYYAVTT